VWLVFYFGLESAAFRGIRIAFSQSLAVQSTSILALSRASNDSLMSNNRKDGGQDDPLQARGLR
jgi:hypothetical protein